MSVALSEPAKKPASSALFLGFFVVKLSPCLLNKKIKRRRRPRRIPRHPHYPRPLSSLFNQQAAAAWGELQSALRRYADTLEVEPDRLRQLEERVNLLLALKRKYGATLAAASSHFVVTKRTEGGRTLSEITLLDRARRVQELARMLGGQTDAALRHAGELLRRGAAA